MASPSANSAGSAGAGRMVFPPFADLPAPTGPFQFDIVGGRFEADHDALVNLCAELFGADGSWEPAGDDVFVDCDASSQPEFLCFRILARSLRGTQPELYSVITHCFVSNPWVASFLRQALGVPALLAKLSATSGGVTVDLVHDGYQSQPVLALKLSSWVGASVTARSLTSLPGALGAGGELKLAQLKQMRDTLDPLRACHQALLLGSTTSTASGVQGVQLELEFLGDTTLLTPSDYCLTARGATPEEQAKERRSFSATLGYRANGLTFGYPTIEPNESGTVRSGREGPPLRLRRGDPQAAPGYEFEDVEIVGFRVPVAPERLRAICDRWLNEPFGNRGYRYAPVNVDLVVECLDYGVMRSDNPPRDIPKEASNRQRELIFRILVVREDSDGRPIGAPAVFCPYVFVDSPWSLVSGREVIGYPKAMAEFDTLETPGQFEVCQVKAQAFDSPRAVPLLYIDCRFEREPANIEAFFNPKNALEPPVAATRLGRQAPIDFAWWGLADLQSARADSEVVITPWLDGKASGYGGVQVKRFLRASQLDEDAYCELVECYYTLLKAEVTLPRHNATLFFPNDPFGLVEELGFDQFVPVPPGSWYRTKANFRFNVTDPLA